MDFKVIEESKDGMKLYLHLKNSSVAFANALRRTVLNHLPGIAVDEVDFYENTSPMPNEYIAARLALIPLTYDKIGVDKTITLTLNVEALNEPIVIYSKDLKSTDDEIKVFDENIPIIKITAGQKLRLEAHARLGIPKTHAKFQTAMASYSYYPKVTVKTPKNKGEVAAACPKHLSDKLDFSNAYKCDACLTAVEIAEPDGSVSLEYDDKAFVFFIESYTNLTAKQQLERALQNMRDRVKELESKL